MVFELVTGRPLHANQLRRKHSESRIADANNCLWISNGIVEPRSMRGANSNSTPTSPEKLLNLKRLSILSGGGFPRVFSSAGDRSRRIFCFDFGVTFDLLLTLLLILEPDPTKTKHRMFRLRYPAPTPLSATTALDGAL